MLKIALALSPCQTSVLPSELLHMVEFKDHQQSTWGAGPKLVLPGNGGRVGHDPTKEMKMKRIFLIATILATVALVIVFVAKIFRPEQITMESSPSGKNLVTEPEYSQLVAAARRDDCDAAYKLGRHHLSITLDTTEAIRWYRLAARCPHAAAKGELVGILMHFESEDAEVERLLTEIEKIDPKAAAGDRAAVESVRSSRSKVAH